LAETEFLSSESNEKRHTGQIKSKALIDISENNSKKQKQANGVPRRKQLLTI